MARRHRNAPSPYEIMTTVPTSPSSADVDPGNAVGQSVSPDTVVAAQTQQPAEAAEGWQAKTRQPIVLRVPHGTAVVILAGMIGLMLLTYWVGRTRGYRLASQAGPVLEGVSLARVGPVVGQQDETAPMQHESPTVAERLDPVIAPESYRTDPRVEGMNYIVLAHYPEPDARRLVAFLVEEGVDAVAARPDGKKYFQVAALRSFAKEDLDSQSYLQYKQRLLRLGRKWKERGFGPNFSGIFPSRYQGHEVAQVITQEDIDHEH